MITPIFAFWCRYPSARNFGDALTPWLIRRIAGEDPVFAEPHDSGQKYLIVGSIMEYATRSTVVWGAGIINLSDPIDPECHILAVRGPLTRQRALECGATCPAIYGDPALLLPKFYTPSAPSERSLIGVVPHYFDKPKVMAHWSPPRNSRIIDIQRPVERVIDDITSCDHVLSSSLHGLIVAHAYGIPALWIRFGDGLLGDGSKFRDYLSSVDQFCDEPISVNIRTFSPEALLPLVPGAPANIDTRSLWAACPFRSAQ
jgi:hypothetical protein